ncbi:tRNA(Ile)-lysidine synthase [Sulfitobacter marinus]|uniref:tRNA(Ile)-lysidine synthase n=1 Tax=Sulfitobacter marinus TaxID=394264 RepID=A0A1I6UDX3_9RHOB|nr:tRNA lysidine(34) synthetase TilS [Sulfitobacter marinus]SFS99620.1 tRNA(Ile)-lysidine synthase [Sulfitobacter marinus]
MTVDLARLIADQFSDIPRKSIGIAVSGGSDSMALLHLLHSFAQEHGTEIFVATVNHGLRAEAAEEAAMVAEVCAQLGRSHHILDWNDWDHSGNLQGEARKARYGLLTQWGRQVGVDCIALGHTMDDQAETFLMRIGRRAGVDGLAAMPHRFDRDGMRWVRPLLQARRLDLRGYLTAQGIGWVDDPSNDDDRFDRVRTRKALSILSELGIDADAISDVSQNLSAAKDALNHQMLTIAREIVTLQAGAVTIDANALAAQHPELRRRLVVHALKWVNGAYYAPRSSAVNSVLDALEHASSATLQGCELRKKGETLWIFRELNAVANTTAQPGELWDNRWHLVPPVGGTGRNEPLSLCALGAKGLYSCKDWRALGIPRAVLLSTPAVWNGTRLIAAPLAGWPQNWQARLNRGEDTFFAAHITH